MQRRATDSDSGQVVLILRSGEHESGEAVRVTTLSARPSPPARRAARVDPLVRLTSPQTERAVHTSNAMRVETVTDVSPHSFAHLSDDPWGPAARAFLFCTGCLARSSETFFRKPPHGRASSTRPSAP